MNMDPEEILKAARATPEKQNLEAYREAVEVLREKGFTWRDIADFLTERGVSTDHTRIYRLFGQKNPHDLAENREIEIGRVNYLGERETKKKKTWNVMEIELPSKLGKPIFVKGFSWGAGSICFATGPDQTLSVRRPMLKIRSRDRGFPMACILAEFKMSDDSWLAQEVYIVPKWEELI